MALAFCFCSFDPINWYEELVLVLVLGIGQELSVIGLVQEGLV